MKIKTFYNTPDPEIQIWLDQHSDIVIHHISQSQSTVNTHGTINGDTPYMIRTIWYSEPDNSWLKKVVETSEAQVWSPN